MHFEQQFTFSRIDTLKTDVFSALPLLLKTGEVVKIRISKVYPRDYPAMFLKNNGANALEAIFPPVVLEALPNATRWPDRNEIISKTAPYIAETVMNRLFPWSVFSIAENDKAFFPS